MFLLLTTLACTLGDTDDFRVPAGRTVPEFTPPGPCSDGTWMGRDRADGMLLVAPFGSDAGDGSPTSPFLTVGAASQVASRAGGGVIGVYPGTFNGRARLGTPARSDETIEVVGCSAAETVLDAHSYSLAAHGEGTFIIRRLALTGGAPTLAVRDGADALVEDVVVNGGTIGVQLVGPTTHATLRRVTVEGQGGPAFGGSASGWGVSVNQGDLDVEDVLIGAWNSYGLFGERAAVRGAQLRVQGDGRFPRSSGVYLVSMREIALSNCEVEDVGGVGVQIVGSRTVSLSGCTVSGVNVAADSVARGLGDGIVVRGPVLAGHPVVSLTDNIVDGAARFGIVLDHVAASVHGNVTVGNGRMHDMSSVWQVGSTVDGDETPATLDPTVDPLGRAEAPGEGPGSYGRRQPPGRRRAADP